MDEVVEVEDPDEFEEEELMILEDLPDHDHYIDNDISNEITDSNGLENHRQQHEDMGYADEDFCDGDSSEAASEEVDGGEGEAFDEDNDFDGEFIVLPWRLLCCICCKPLPQHTSLFTSYCESGDCR